MLIFVAAWGLAQPALALMPEQVFSKAGSSVTMVFALEGSVAVQGSGVVVGYEKVVTNCHVVLNKNGAARPRLTVKHHGETFSANLLTSDVQYDTCLLKVAGLRAQPVTIANVEALRVGQRVYAIGAPSGLDLTLTDGLISSLRVVERTRVLQTSAPISPGSSGGGLFNEDGDLIGITSFRIGDGAGLNFAYLADRVLSLVSLANGIGDSSDRDSMAGSGRAPLQAGMADKGAPDPVFPDLNEKLAWLASMSQRLTEYAPNLDKVARLDLLKTIHYESQRAGLDPQLVLALIDRVSGFRKNEVSPTGARGYMQVRPYWVELIGNKDQNLLHLRTNLRYGCTILRHFLDLENGNLYRALIRYQNDMAGNGVATISYDDATFPNSVRSLWESRWGWISVRSDFSVNTSVGSR